MSASKREKKRDTSGRKSSGPREHKKGSAFYLYCVGLSPSLTPLLNDSVPSAIEDDGPLEVVEEDGLGAVASPVSLNDYGEDALRTHLSDAQWVALRAMRHERVVDYFAKRASIIPLRFGVIYLDRVGIGKMLAERGEELREGISRLEGREEWGVNVFCDSKTLLDTIVSYSPLLRELNEEAARSAPGQAYLVRKKMDSMRKEEARKEVKRTVESIEGELRKQSKGSTRLRLLKDEGGEQGELVGKLAFLVERARLDEFRSAAERLAAEHAGAGFRLEMTGPWPAYNFIAPD